VHGIVLRVQQAITLHSQADVFHKVHAGLLWSKCWEVMADCCQLLQSH